MHGIKICVGWFLLIVIGAIALPLICVLLVIVGLAGLGMMAYDLGRWLGLKAVRCIELAIKSIR